MSRVPRKPRRIARSSDALDPRIAGRALVSRADPKQADLFAPTFIPPMLPTLSAKAPKGDRWQYEIKHDGYRVQAHLRDGQVRLYTRRGHDWTDRMPGIVAAVQALPCRSAILDGEAIIEDAEGLSDFFALHAKLTFGSAPEASLIAFDLLQLYGEDVRSRPLAERRAMLAETVIRAPHGLDLSEHLTEGGEAMFRAACEMGLEGIVAKRVDAPYVSGRADTWRKVKSTRTEAFAVIGFDPEGRHCVRCLRLARLQDGDLAPCGSVGSGISAAVSRELRTALEGGVHVVVDVEFRGFTPAGELRHPVFKGWHAGGQRGEM